MAEESQSQPVEWLSGQVERVTFHNPDNGFCVLRVKVRGHRDLVTVLGHSATVCAGEYIQAGGTWMNDRTYGLQFRATSLRTALPASRIGIERYLGSGLIKGIGPHYARRLVEVFGEDVFRVIEETPQRLKEVEGIGEVRAERIVAGWAEQKAIREIMVFLHTHGVGSSRAVRIYRTYGNEAIDLITENPYRLAQDIRGIGFVTADAIAQRLGFAKDCLPRARAGVVYALAQAMEDGHCGLPKTELAAGVEKLLAIPATLAEQAIAAEVQAGSVIADSAWGQECIFLAGLYRAEQNIAARLLRLAQGYPPWGEINTEAAINWVEGKLGISLAETQRRAMRLALQSKIVVITGGPGVGKTTLINAILTVLRAKRVKIALCAPTGRAAKRLAECTGQEAKTIHRLLETNPKNGAFRRNEENPVPCDLLVVDEMSMVDVPLMNALTRAVPKEAALILVGDVDQLPSVGPGQVLADIVNSGAVPVVRLTEVFRQASHSRIIVNAHRINRGEMPEIYGDKTTDFQFVQTDGPDAALAAIIRLVHETLPRRFGFHPLRDIQVLCPMNRGSSGVRNLNIELQKRLNPRRGEAERVERFGWTYAVGDKVMQLENDYEKDVYNGDVGFVFAVDHDANELTVDYDERKVVYDFGELDCLMPAYACTIHKSQGSEYPAVVIPVTTQHFPMLKRNILYTGVTRGKRLVVIVGQPKAIAIAVRGDPKGQRWSKLREWLK